MVRALTLTARCAGLNPAQSYILFTLPALVVYKIMYSLLIIVMLFNAIFILCHVVSIIIGLQTIFLVLLYVWYHAVILQLIIILTLIWNVSYYWSFIEKTSVKWSMKCKACSNFADQVADPLPQICHLTDSSGRPGGRSTGRSNPPP